MNCQDEIMTAVVVGEWREGPAEARRQHEWLLRVLRELELQILSVNIPLPFPESLLLEDSVVICKTSALLTPQPSKLTIKTQTLSKVLKDYGLDVIQIVGEEIKLRGADVVWTGQELFVGVGEGTNEAGARAVAKSFPDVPTTAVKIEGKLPLKRYISMCGDGVLAVCASGIGAGLAKRIGREAHHTYHTITLPEEEAVNTLYIGDTLLHRAIEEAPQSFKVLLERVHWPRRSLCWDALEPYSYGISSVCIPLPIIDH